MENVKYGEELVREFLIFRGFSSTLQVFESELCTDIGKGFQVEKIMELVFSVYIPRFEVKKLVTLMGFLRNCLFSPSDVNSFLTALTKLEASVFRHYIVHALKSSKRDKVVEFFGEHGNDLLRRAEDWTPWFSIPYLKNPSLDPQFQLYFSKEWTDALHLSFRNFLSGMFSGSRIPALLKLSSEKLTIRSLKKDIVQLRDEISQLQASLNAKEIQLCQLRSSPPTVPKANAVTQISHLVDPSSSGESLFEGKILVNGGSNMDSFTSSSQLRGSRVQLDNSGDSLIVDNLVAASSQLEINSSVPEQLNCGDVQTKDSAMLQQSCGGVMSEEDFPEVKAEFQETFLGHTSPISRSRFSAAGANIASASVDGTVRIWTYDSSTSTSRNATIYCGAEIMSLEWESKSDRLLLIGTADGGIKAWNVDAKRLVCDFSTSSAFPRVLDLKCSPTEPIFVSAAASKGQQADGIDSMGYASLTVWNMKTWKAMTVLPLGEDPPAVTSICFNHNGKILAASATDGMIHIFDMSASLQITGWPAHDSAVSSVKFGPDETSLFSLGSDGKIYEWSLHNQGRILWSRDSSRYCSSENMQIPRHEMALDWSGRSLLVSSSSSRSPIYHIQDNLRGLRTLPHSASITTVDWHPTMPIYLTGSADNSIRVTSIHN